MNEWPSRQRQYNCRNIEGAQWLNNLEKLLYLRGVAAEYFNYSGERIFIPYEQRLQFLCAAGYDLDNHQQIEQAIFELDAQPWTRWLQTVNVISLEQTEYVDIRMPQHQLFSQFNWQVTTEQGDTVSGIVTPGELEEVGEYYIDGQRYSAHRLPIRSLPLGYHQLKLWDNQFFSNAQLIVVPPRCYELPLDNQSNISSSDRLWGINCQLYTLRSKRNWGIGDFSDLLELIDYCAAAKMDFIGLNPLHAPHFNGADFASPYSPSDRRFLNPLYIDLEIIPDFVNSKTISKLINNRGFKQKLKSLRSASLVDYDGVMAIKFWVFEELFKLFTRYHISRKSARAKAFQQFVEDGGDILSAFCDYEANHCGMEIKAAKDPRFHQYLQWIAHLQLSCCQQQAIDSGMSVGLLGDLAVGAVRGGAEVTGKQTLFCQQASIGAPPDPLAELGQNWNLPALDPISLKKDNYQHFIDLLRANMRYCNALRIDHVMGLLRLWWCMPELSSSGYVYYPLDILLAIVRLESHRNQCLVIGEDMGVVPDELRQQMSKTSMYGNLLFYFEKDYHQQFSWPNDHKVDALLMVTNHDVPTLAGWWNRSELELKKRLNVLDSNTTFQDLLNQRQSEKAKLLVWLQSQQLLPDSWGMDSTDRNVDKPFDLSLCEAILKACAHSRAIMMSFQLEDLQLIEEPVNVPGTYREYPNWRRKQRLETQALFENKKIQAVLASTFKERMHE